VITAWRLVDLRYADDAFSGEGARLTKGRWHSAGTRIVYTSQYTSLAALELIARTRRPQLLPQYALVSCGFHEALVEDVDRALLPANWFEFPPPPELQRIGDSWALSRSSAVLAVPSAIVPQELNYLLNPEHPDFRSIEIGLPRPFRLDLRLLT
jgi:RES domain-containing protein